jgi:hypothetical protein
MVQFLRGEGIELFEKPKVPDNTENIHAKTHNKKPGEPELNKRNFATDKEWLDYCEWTNKLSQEAIQHFTRGVQIGIQLNEAWLVCQGLFKNYQDSIFYVYIILKNIVYKLIYIKVLHTVLIICIIYSNKKNRIKYQIQFLVSF